MFLSQKWKFSKPFGRVANTLTQRKLQATTFGDYVLVSKQACKISYKQIEAMKLVLRRLLKRQSKFSVNLPINTRLTKLSNESRLGKGKAVVKHWYSAVSAGSVITQLKGCSTSQSVLGFRKIKTKTGMKTFSINKHTRWVL